MTIRVTTAAALLAQIKARQQAKAELQRKGEKVSHYSAREITVLAQQWFDAHGAEIMPDCLAQARAMMLSGSLGKRAQREANEAKVLRPLRSALTSDVAAMPPSGG
jgi:hypothetical protein